MTRKQFFLTLSVAIISGVLGGALSVWFLMPQSVLAQEGVPELIEAREFRVVDGEGRIRARLGHDTYGSTQLLFFDETGEDRIILALGISGPFLQLQESSTGPAASLSLDSLGFWQSQLRPGNFISLALSDNGPMLRLVDEDGTLRAALGTTELKHSNTGSTEIRATSSLVLFNEEGNVVWSAP